MNDNENMVDQENINEQEFTNAADVVNTASNIVSSTLKKTGISANPQSTQPMVAETAQESALTNDGENSGSPDVTNIARGLAALPIESLICAPILAAAKGQQELTAVYIDGVKQLAYNSENSTNKLDFKVNKPVIGKDNVVKQESFNIEAPLLAIVPVPAFMMDELTVEFNMEVKTADLTTSETKASVESTVKYNSWFGLNASITGNVTTDSTHKRQTDTSATYHITARAIQQPPTEGMSKLTALLAQAMEPINTSGGGE